MGRRHEDRSESVGVRAAPWIIAHTVAVIYSDGMEVGDVSDLKRAMRELRRRSAAVVWMNPLASTPGYEPSARGMQAAMPHVTSFLGIRDARDLAWLAQAMHLVR